MLAVVVTDIAVDGALQFERRRVGTSPRDLRELAAWLVAEAVEEVVMESTAQYWRPVWEALERAWLPQRRTRDGASPAAGSLHLAQAQSNRGRKRDFLDAERLVKRLVAQELTLSFVPDAAQRLWRTVTRRKYQLTRNRVQVHNRIEALLEDAYLKLSRLVSDLLGRSARRMLAAVAEGETDPAALADRRLRATPEQLGDALGAATALNPVYRRLIGMALEDLRLIEAQIQELDQELARLLGPHQDQVHAAVGRRAGARRGFGAAGHCGSRADGPDVSVREATRVLGGGVSRRGGKCGHQREPPLAERQPADAPSASPRGQRGGQDQGQYSRAGVSAPGPPLGARPGDRGDCPSAVSTDLEDPASGCSLRGTRPCRQRSADAGPCCQDDSRSATPRLSSRVRAVSIRNSMSGSVFRSWFEEFQRLVPAN